MASRWNSEGVKGTLFRRKYVREDIKECYEKKGLSERFYVACNVEGWTKKVDLYKGIEEDAIDIYGKDDLRARQDDGVPVEIQLVEYTRPNDLLNDNRVGARRFIVMSIQPDSGDDRVYPNLPLARYG